MIPRDKSGREIVELNQKDVYIDMCRILIPFL